MGDEKPLNEDINQALKTDGTRTAAGSPVRLWEVRARSSVRMR
jgi:hypothetical protein